MLGRLLRIGKKALRVTPIGGVLEALDALPTGKDNSSIISDALKALLEVNDVVDVRLERIEDALADVLEKEQNQVAEALAEIRARLDVLETHPGTTGGLIGPAGLTGSPGPEGLEEIKERLDVLENELEEKMIYLDVRLNQLEE